MPEKRRSHFDTIYEILRACDRGAKISHILRRANLNHGQFKRYLTLLLGFGLVEEVENEYRTTAKGMEFMSSFEKLVRIMNEPREERRG